MRRQQSRLGRSLAAGAAVLAVAFGTGAAGARAAPLRTCDPSAYAVSARTLTTPRGAAGLAIQVTTIPPCPVPETLPAVHALVHALRGNGVRHVDVLNVASPGGVAAVPLGRVLRHQAVDVSIFVEPDIALVRRTRALLRPDLVVRRVGAPRHTLAGRPFGVAVTVAQRTPDLASTATVTISEAGTALATGTVRIAPKRRAVLRLPVTLPATGRTQLLVSVDSDLPELTKANNTSRVTLEATSFEVLRSNVVVHSLAGYGGQFNHHVYAAISRQVGVTDANVVEMERKMRLLHPQFSRVFFSPIAFTDPDRMQSFVRTVMLAQSTGTTINVTWQGGTLNVASGTVQKFANVLLDLVQNRGVTRLRWLTLQNEPNRTKMTPEQYEAQYRALDPYIQSIRGQVKYMGGDLTRGPDTGPPNQELWFGYMATHMADILDAYSIHVFWDYWDTQKLQDRLNEVRAIVDSLPPSGQKPLYVAEYGVRGLRTFNGVRTLDPGVWTDGTPITQTNVSAFQHAWFDVLSARLGYLGTSKWDAYFGRYDNAEQAYYMIGGPDTGWAPYPMYNLMRLMTSTVKPGWEVLGVDELDGTTQLTTAYRGPKSRETLIGLDTAGAQLNDASGGLVPYSVGGLPAARRLTIVLWNETGDGTDGPARGVTVDNYGVASFAVPQHAVFALTTVSSPLG